MAPSSLSSRTPATRRDGGLARDSQYARVAGLVALGKACVGRASNIRRNSQTRATSARIGARSPRRLESSEHRAAVRDTTLGACRASQGRQCARGERRSVAAAGARRRAERPPSKVRASRACESDQRLGAARRRPSELPFREGDALSLRERHTGHVARRSAERHRRCGGRGVGAWNLSVNKGILRSAPQASAALERRFDQEASRIVGGDR